MGAYNGSGTFVRSYSWTSDAANGILIRSDRTDTEDNGFATGLSTAICKDGQQTTTARIPFAVGLSVNQGSVAVPSISVSGDTTTGFYQTTLGEVRFGSAGTYAASFNANGLDNTPVGIGTPAAGKFTTLLVGGVAPVITVKQQIITATGAFTYTPSTGMLYCLVECTAAGGGSGGVAVTTGGQVAASGGGGGGGYCRKVFTAATIGVSQAGSVGAGGIAGTAGANAGGTGGNTTFGALLTANGGGPGAGGSATALLTAAVSTGGVGGTGTSGTLNINGGDGEAAIAYTTNMIAGGAGGSTALATSRINNQGFTAAGAAGYIYGGGAAGATNNPSGSALAGAAGAAGVVIITEFCSQ